MKRLYIGRVLESIVIFTHKGCRFDDPHERPHGHSVALATRDENIIEYGKLGFLRVVAL
jgi:hypothetical protein